MKAYTVKIEIAAILKAVLLLTFLLFFYNNNNIRTLTLYFLKFLLEFRARH